MMLVLGYNHAAILQPPGSLAPAPSSRTGAGTETASAVSLPQELVAAGVALSHLLRKRTRTHLALTLDVAAVAAWREVLRVVIHRITVKVIDNQRADFRSSARQPFQLATANMAWVLTRPDFLVQHHAMERKFPRAWRAERVFRQIDERIDAVMGRLHPNILQHLTGR